MSSETAFKSTANRQSAGLRRAGHLALVFMLTATTLLSLATSVEAAAGDLTVSPADARAGKINDYSVTYFFEEAASGSSGEPLIVSFELPNTYELDADDSAAVKHSYPAATHQWDIRKEPATTAGPPLVGPSASPSYWNIEFSLIGSFPANYKLAFQVEVQNPLKVGSYTMQSVLGGSDSGTASIAVQYVDPKTTVISWDGDTSTGSDPAVGNFVLTPSTETDMIQVTLPQAFTLKDSTALGAGWAVHQTRIPSGDDARPFILRYDGSALDAGVKSTIPLNQMQLTPNVGSFVFSVLEHDDINAQVRLNTFTFDVTPNDQIEARFLAAKDGQGFASEAQTTNIAVSGFNDVVGTPEDEGPVAPVTSSNDPNGQFIVQFPAGFLLNNVGAGDVILTQETAAGTAAIDYTVAIDVATRTLTFTVGDDDQIDGDLGVNLYVDDLLTPPRIGETEAFRFATKDNTGKIVDEVKTLRFNVLPHAAISNAQILPYTVPTPSNLGLAGQDGGLEFKFSITSAGPRDARVYFPQTIQVSQNQTYVAMIEKEGTLVETDYIVDPVRNSISISLGGLSVGKDGFINGSIEGFKFPVSTSTVNVRLVTVGSNDAEWDSGSRSITVSPNALSGVTVSRTESDLGESGPMSLTLSSKNLLVNSTKIQVALPEGYSLSAASAGVSVNGKSIPAAKVAISGSTLTVSLNETTTVTKDSFELKVSSVKNPKLRANALDGGTLAVTYLGVDGTQTATGTAKLPTLTVPDGAPVAYHMTPADLKAFNDLIELDVKETRDGMRLRWTLPEGELVVRGQQVPVEGIQIWESNSPYSLIATYDADEDEFGFGEHMEPLTSDNPKFLVTMFYTDDIGKYESGEAPDTDDYPGTESSGVVWTWQWFVIGGVALILVAVVVLLVVLNRRR